MASGNSQSQPGQVHARLHFPSLLFVVAALAASLTLQGCGKGDKTPAAGSAAVSLAGRWECSASKTKIVGTALEPYIGKDKFEMLVEPKSAAVKEGFYFTPSSTDSSKGTVKLGVYSYPLLSGSLDCTYERTGPTTIRLVDPRDNNLVAELHFDDLTSAEFSLNSSRGSDIFRKVEWWSWSR